jgi:hypothetical protein
MAGRFDIQRTAEIIISLYFIVIVLSGCSGSKHKFFSGTIEYAYTYISDSLNMDSLSASRPAKSSFRYDTNNYQSQFINKDTVSYYYSGELNKCISETNSQQNYECEDYGAFTDSILSWKLYDTEEKILGYSCNILEMQKVNSWVKYYVSKELTTAPATYRKHKSYNWDIYGEKTEGGLILKSEHRFKKFTMTGIAIEVKNHDGNFKAFDMDKKKMAEICNKN